MAIITRPLVTFYGPAAQSFAVSLDYDNGVTPNRATTLRVLSTFLTAVTVTLTRDSDGRAYSRAFGAGTSTLSIPTTAANRLPVTVLASGTLRGFGFSAASPEV